MIRPELKQKGGKKRILGGKKREGDEEEMANSASCGRRRWLCVRGKG